MNWELQILGANSAVPTLSRYPSGQVLTAGSRHILIDCGEGSQLRMLKYGVKKSRISLILISHLHGDHIFGLPGLLTSYNLYDRQRPLRMIGPPGLKFFVENIVNFAGHDFKFSLEIEEISFSSPQSVFEDTELEIRAFPLVHGVPAYGYMIREKMNRKYLNKEKVKSLDLSVPEIKKILRGEGVRAGDRTYYLEDVERKRIPRSYAYVSDTAYFPKCAEYVSGATLLYHESTFLESDRALAEERYHSTAGGAADTALHAGARHLLLGHYSSRYSDVERFGTEARETFPSVYLALSGKKYFMDPEGEITENEDFLRSN